MADIYDEKVYKQFYENLIGLLNGPNIKHVTLNDIKKKALQTGIRTKFGSYGWKSSVSSRIAPKTVHLGSPKIRLSHLTDLQKSIIKNAPDELHKVLHLIRTLPFIHLRRQMGSNAGFNPICNLYISVADPNSYRIAYMWGNTLKAAGQGTRSYPYGSKRSSPLEAPGPELMMIDVPEDHQLKQQTMVLSDHNLTIALATDYMGEIKKTFLRNAMWCADELGMIGLHSGTKIVNVRSVKDNKLKKYGVFLFGMTATGKSTWACHQLGLNHRDGEKTEAVQDDVVFLKNSGEALGSEANFYVKTDVSKDSQEAMYNALIDRTALLENVMINSKSEPDFIDESLSANGRAIIRKDKLMVKRGKRMIRIDYKGIDLPSPENLDGLIFVFITRRNTIMPFAQELTPEQSVLAFLWGETVRSFASEPDRAGESVRVVGTDPFITGQRGRKVNRFYDIVMGLVERFHDKIKCFQYNTGGVGEVIEKYTEYGAEKRRMVRKATRIPINLMADIQRGDLRGTNKYEKGRFGTKELIECEGNKLTEYNSKRFYSEEEIEKYLTEIIEGRKKFTEEIANEGLRPEIIRTAESSFSIGTRKKAQVVIPSKDFKEVEAGLKPAPTYEWQPNPRVPRPPIHRHK